MYCEGRNLGWAIGDGFFCIEGVGLMSVGTPGIARRNSVLTMRRPLILWTVLYDAIIFVVRAEGDAVILCQYALLKFNFRSLINLAFSSLLRC